MSINISGEQSGLKTKIVAFILLIFMTLAAALTPFAMVLGQSSSTSLGVSIIAVVPASEANSVTTIQSVYNGSAGQLYNVKGTIYTSNGTYNVIMGNTIVASGTASGLYVDTNFTVPQLTGGDYNFLIEDIKEGDLNSTGTTPEQFLITVAYSINSATAYNQEGSTVGLTAEVTGGNSGASYVANVTVVLPSPLNGNFSDEVTMVANSVGTATAQLSFPSSSFTSGDSLSLGDLTPTDFVGNYTLYFNMTSALAESQFQVGFLDSATYHRSSTVTVAAQGYAAGQTATLTVTNAATGSNLYSSQSLTAGSNGVIGTTFVVPSTAAVGGYWVNITTTSGTAKLLQDDQELWIPGYHITVTTLNLAGQVISSILVTVQDQLANTSYNSTSGANGQAGFSLENGPYGLTASWKGVTIGTSNITVNGAGSFNLQCDLTNLEILVQNENGTALPFVNLQIICQYGSSSSDTINSTGETDYSGIFTLNSTMTGVGLSGFVISYTIEASMYNRVFNAANDTLSNLPAQATYKFVIICPTEQATINIVGYNNAPIPGANLQLVELTNGLFYTATTDSSGSATAPLTFGVYKLQIYQNGILLNQTTIDAFTAGTDNIRCTLYGIHVTVSVVDYFGSPISNVNVTLNGPASERFSAITDGSGTTTFNNVIGGNMQVIAFAKGTSSSYQALALTVDQPTSVQIRMGGYVAFGSLLVPTSALFTLIMTIVLIVVLVCVELFLRRRRNHTSAES